MSFTGSKDVGRTVSERSAPSFKKVHLEMGGKNVVMVMDDATLDLAIDGCVWGGFANAGQTCSGIERTYVVKDVADRFVEGVVRRASELTVGDPTEWGTEIGPMVSEDQFGVVSELVDDALENGAERVAGGPREVPGFSGRFIAPTVLAGVEDEINFSDPFLGDAGGGIAGFSKPCGGEESGSALSGARPREF